VEQRTSVENRDLLRLFCVVCFLLFLSRWWGFTDGFVNWGFYIVEDGKDDLFLR